jgi:NAD(P)-dependent dehydrogenase (short-subunit alcohol dehydrogenase family)
LHRHDLTMEVNYRAPYLAIREVYPHMERRGGGSIVNVLPSSQSRTCWRTGPRRSRLNTSPWMSLESFTPRASQ